MRTSQRWFGWTGLLLPLLVLACAPDPRSNENCGDGIIDPEETCDDGNTEGGDGCSACQVDPGFTCADEPSTCSACARDCLGGACVDGVCQPVFLADVDSGYARLGVDAKHVYWTNHDNGTIHRVAITGGAAEVIATGQAEPVGIVVDPTGVYWGNQGSVMKLSLPLPFEGGTPVVLATGPLDGYNLAVDAVNVYYTTIYEIVRVGKDGSNLSIINANPQSPAGIAIDSQYVYWAELKPDGNIKRQPLAGGAETILASALPGPGFVAVDSTHVYWTNLDAPSVMKASLNGGPVETVSMSDGAGLHITTDANYVYWVTAGGPLRAAPIGGGPAFNVTGQSVYGFTMDDKALYYVDGGKLMKLAK